MSFESDVEGAAALMRKEPLVMTTRRQVLLPDVGSLLMNNRLFGLSLRQETQPVRDKLQKFPSFYRDGNLPQELRITAVQTPTAMGTPMNGVNAITWLCGYDPNGDVYTIVGLARFMFERAYEVDLRFLTKKERIVLSKIGITHLA